jgi:hypothetical protein
MKVYPCFWESKKTQRATISGTTYKRIKKKPTQDSPPNSS